ncbi:unnamed protein product [Effrenium voratum]|nr:unnamed protein product [Effrenium voratum]
MDFLKRPLEGHVPQGEAKRLAEGFRGLGREGYLQQRVHRKLHGSAVKLSDEDLQSLGELSFHDQFDALEQMLASHGEGAEGLFQQLGFQGYLQQRVHRKLHGVASKFTSEELLALGKLSFSEQFRSLGLPGPEEERAMTQGVPQQRMDVFGPIGRSGYLHQRVHRKLHPMVIALTDQELFQLGQLSFNEQFSHLGAEGESPFGDMGREGYLRQRVHRMLQTDAAHMSDQDLMALGALSFKEQFIHLGKPGPQQELERKQLGSRNAPRQADAEDMTAGFPLEDREAYIQQHVHRKLQRYVTTMSDQEVFNLGKLSFNEQFRTLSVDATEADEADFGQLGRAGYIQQHVHRRLHNRAAQLNDKDLLELGKLDFNEQFVVLQTPGPRETGEEEAQAIFGEAGREGYLQQRVHRMLHAHVVHLSNLELVKLGEMSFSEQFTALGRPGPKQMDARAMKYRPEASSEASNLRGLSRQEFMQQRVHRKLHAQAAYLSDAELGRLGALSFNEQFDALSALQARETSKIPSGRSAAVFGGMDRDTFMQQRVHRRLHGRAAVLPDEELARLGQLSFKDQFPTLELLEAG